MKTTGIIFLYLVFLTTTLKSMPFSNPSDSLILHCSERMEHSNGCAISDKLSAENPYFWSLVRSGLYHIYKNYLVPIGVNVGSYYLNRKIDNYIEYSAERYSYDPEARRNVHHIADEWSQGKDYGSAYYHIANCGMCNNTAGYLSRD